MNWFKKMDDGFKRVDEKMERKFDQVGARIEKVHTKIDRLTYLLLLTLLGIVLEQAFLA